MTVIDEYFQKVEKEPLEILESILLIKTNFTHYKK